MNGLKELKEGLDKIVGTESARGFFMGNKKPPCIFYDIVGKKPVGADDAVICNICVCKLSLYFCFRSDEIEEIERKIAEIFEKLRFPYYMEEGTTIAEEMFCITWNFEFMEG